MNPSYDRGREGEAKTERSPASLIKIIMDQSVVESQGGRRSPVLLGYFLQPIYEVYKNLDICPSPTPTFLPSSDEGSSLKEGEWGDLDENLSFIGQTVYIKSSSGGLLLCCFELSSQDDYCICNPVTREWRALPRPNKSCEFAEVSFSCRGGEASLDRADFTVVRSAVSLDESTRELEIETFSSKTGEWRESLLTCPRPFLLQRCSFEIDQVIYWQDIKSCLLAYDLTTSECLEIIERPGGAENNFIPYSNLWALSEGRIFCARHDCAYLEVWTLEKKNTGGCGGYESLLVSRVSLDVLQLIPEKKRRGKVVFNGLKIAAIHPHDQRLLLLTWNGEEYWYNHNSREVRQFSVTTANSTLPSTYFSYEWPSGH